MSGLFGPGVEGSNLLIPRFRGRQSPIKRASQSKESLSRLDKTPKRDQVGWMELIEKDGSD